MSECGERGKAGAAGESPGLGKLIAVGGRTLNRHSGLVAVLFLVQVAIAAGGGFVMARALSAAFARRPLFDDAVDGDLAALLQIARTHGPLLLSLLWIGLGTAALYLAVSWFLAGGLIATLLAEKPAPNRREAAERFGAGGAVTFFAYARLTLWSLIPYTLVALALGLGLARAAAALDTELRAGPFALALALDLLPAGLLAWVTTTALDYARIDLSRHERLSSLRALLRGYKLAVRRPLALAHQLLYFALFAGVSALYIAISHDRPMLGASGAISLFFVRQAVALVRFAAHLALIGGQVEYARAAQGRPTRG